ncbi:putative adapter-related protein complex 1 beta 1 subunit [Ceraceosorus guamensis]|uniref:AP complex subunit beta n=1 Tax=Ceraceosorus guamensis TaxID=1522189 RepID=A0A316W839_9BASI|nr:putative adapter-related protein complex 1 beta 1 subunit [Ceraceosorus guamensis]PWN44213.1 putative adapter-related protein complex 1 beta 1 subunit [Ceraceosorus guamensis]
MSRPRFFTAPRKGENFELRADLNSEYRDRRKDAIKRVIANMTVGKDVSGLFPDVLKNMQTEDLEQKKLVYLYLMNYAKTQPELVILAVNTFVKDSDDPNPLVRALAIRTMSCLRAEKIIDYLSDPLSKALRDDNPYVRKTAAICVAKLYEMKPEMAIEDGFVGLLRDLVGDANPMVVANAVTALTDIHQTALEADPSGQTALFVIDNSILARLLIALNECTEWGRIAILSSLARYKPAPGEDGDRDAEHICERVVPQFQHANGSVVLSAVKVIMIHMDRVQKPEFVKQLVRKMAPPLVTLVSSAPEVQWVALRNINLILQKRPDVLSTELRIFFCKYNDPSYVKLEKLGIMIKLANERNVDMLLSELKEYASEVDVDFVRRSIRAIGQCAIKIDDAAERCVHVLLDLIATRVSYVVQEAVVVIKDIFRKYPSNYEGIIPTLCSNLEDLDEPEAKASLIWILGDYAEKIENSDELLASFLDNFVDEQSQVQFSILTAVVKLFLKRPDGSQGLVQRTLELATKSADNPDLRDRAFIYWRLLSSSDTGAGKSIVLADRPAISIPLTTISPALLEELIADLSSLASAYHKPESTFIGRGRLGADAIAKKREEVTREKALATVVQGQGAENLLDFDADEDPAAAAPAPTGGLGGLDDLMMSDDTASAATSSAATSNAASAQQQQASLNDLLGLFDAAPPTSGTGNTSALDFLNSMPSAPTAAPVRNQAPAQQQGGDLLDLI